MYIIIGFKTACMLIQSGKKPAENREKQRATQTRLKEG